MKHRLPRPRRPSSALVVATIALFVALTGSAAATRALITSRDIKNGTIQTVDLSPTAKTSLHSWSRRARTAGSLRDDRNPDVMISAASQPQKGELLPLGNNKQFPESVVPLDSTTKAPNIAARVYSSHDEPTKIQIAFGPVQQLTFDQVSFDTDHLFDPQQPSRLTAPVGGVYVITTSVSWAVQGTSLNGVNRAVYVTVNDHVIAVDQRPPAAETRQVVTTIYRLNPGDAVQVGIGQDAGDLTANAVGDYAPSLAMAWIAPG
jgi:hypothetical protein